MFRRKEKKKNGPVASFSGSDCRVGHVIVDVCNFIVGQYNTCTLVRIIIDITKMHDTALPSFGVVTQKLTVVVWWWCLCSGAYRYEMQAINFP